MIRKEYIPDGANILPSTWDLKVKRYPDGRMYKKKSRFCDRGDKHIVVVYYYESYATITTLNAVQMVMNFATQRGWDMHQVDFSNAFVQAELKDEFCVELPEMLLDDQNNNDKNGLALKINQSIYGLVQAPLSWYNNIQKGITKLDFKVVSLEPDIYYSRVMTSIT